MGPLTGHDDLIGKLDMLRIECPKCRRSGKRLT
jgi:hypothetical protein